MIDSQICINFKILGENGEKRTKKNEQDEKTKLEHWGLTNQDHSKGTRPRLP